MSETHTSDMNSRLAIALKRNNFDEVESLLKSGASPDACDIFVCY